MKIIGVGEILTKLKDLQVSICKIHDSRRQIVSTRRKPQTGKNKRKLYPALCHLFTAFEGASLKYPAINYQLLANELNEQIRAQRTVNAARMTRLKNEMEKQIKSDIQQKEI